MPERRMLLLSSVAIAFGAGVLTSHIASSFSADLSATSTTTARSWVERMGIHASGISCDPNGRCTIAPSAGVPYAVFCDLTMCQAETCPR